MDILEDKCSVITGPVCRRAMFDRMVGQVVRAQVKSSVESF